VRKILYLISLQQKHFRRQFKQILEATTQGYNFCFFDHFWKFIMWPPSQWPIGWTLTCIIILILVSSPFGNPQWYVFFWICTLEWTLKAVLDILYTIPIFSDFSPNFPDKSFLIWMLPWTLKTVPQHHHHQQEPFLYFFCFFWLFLGRFPYLEVHPGPWNQCSMLSATVSTIPCFSLIFLLFYCCFFYCKKELPEGNKTKPRENEVSTVKIKIWLK